VRDDLVRWAAAHADAPDRPVPTEQLGRTIGRLTTEKEAQPARAVVLAYDLDLPLLG
jgi:hypothetical protein